MTKTTRCLSITPHACIELVTEHLRVRLRHLGLDVQMDKGRKMLQNYSENRTRPSSEELVEIMFMFPSTDCIRVHLHVGVRNSSKSVRGL